MSNTGKVDMTYANTLKTAGACAILGMAAVTAAVSGAHAEPTYDTKLAKFLADKAAETLGDLRLGAVHEVAALPEATETFFGRTGTDAIETGSIISLQPQPLEAGTQSDAGETRWLMPRTDIRVVYAG
jgi:hypothetical protein